MMSKVTSCHRGEATVKKILMIATVLVLATAPAIGQPEPAQGTPSLSPTISNWKNQLVAALERNKRYMRGEIARRVNLKFAPEIRFRIDERFDEAERIEKLLRTPEVQRDLDGEKDEQ